MKTLRAIARLAVAASLAACGLTVMGEQVTPDAGSTSDGSTPDATTTDGTVAEGSVAEGSVVEGSVVEGSVPEAGADADAPDVDVPDAIADAGADARDASDADAAPPCLARAPGMLAWWTGDGNMTDLAANHDGKSGTEGGPGVSNVTYGAGHVGQAFALGGTSYVEAPDSPQLEPARITIEGWIRATALGGRIVDKIGAGASNGYLLDTYSGLRIIVGSGAAAATTAAVPLNTWVHVAGTFDGTNLRLYVNGTEVATKASNAALPANNLTVRLGADSDGNNRFAGALDEIAIYDRALTQAELAAIHAAGSNGRCKP